MLTTRLNRKIKAHLRAILSQFQTKLKVTIKLTSLKFFYELYTSKQPDHSQLSHFWIVWDYSYSFIVIRFCPLLLMKTLHRYEINERAYLINFSNISFFIVPAYIHSYIQWNIYSLLWKGNLQRLYSPIIRIIVYLISL